MLYITMEEKYMTLALITAKQVIVLFILIFSGFRVSPERVWDKLRSQNITPSIPRSRDTPIATHETNCCLLKRISSSDLKLCFTSSLSS